jgi:hypothetical protein
MGTIPIGPPGTRTGYSISPELSDLLGQKPVRSHLVHTLVQLDRDFTAARPADRWEDWYTGRFGTSLRLQQD